MKSNDELVDLKDLGSKIIKHWWLFLISVIVTFTLAYFLDQQQSTVSYNVISKMAFKGSGKESKTFVGELEYFHTPLNMDANLAELQSSNLMEIVVDSLDLNLELTGVSGFRKKIIYQSAPFSVQLLNEVKSPFKIIIILSEPEKYEIYDEENKELTVLNSKEAWSFQGTEFMLVPKSEQPSEFKSYELVFETVEQKSLALVRKLEVEIPFRNGRVLELSLRSENPMLGKVVLDGIMEQYLKSEKQQRFAETQNAIKFIDEQIKKVYSDLVVLEGELISFREDSEVVDFSEEQKTLSKRRQEAESELQSIETDLAYYDYLFKAIENYDSTSSVPTPVGKGDQVLNGLILRFSELNNDLTLAKSGASDLNPRVIAIQSKISNTISAITQNLNDRKSNTLLQKQLLESVITDTRRSLAKIPKNQTQFLRLSKRKNVSEGLHKYLSERRAEIGIGQAAYIPSAQITQKAIVLGITSASRPIKFLLALIIALGGPTIWVWKKGDFIQTVQDHTDLEVIEGADVTIVLNYSSKYLPPIDFLSTKFAAATRFLRRDLLSKTRKHEGSEVILFTSYDHSSTSAEVAYSLGCLLASSERKTVLLSLDLRDRFLDNFLGISGSPGVDNYLKGGVELPDLIQSSELENLSILPAGSSSVNNPSDLILIKNKELFRELKLQFDYVLVHVSSLREYSEGYEISVNADQVVHIFAQNQSSRKSINKLSADLNKGALTNVNICLLSGKTSE